MTLDQAMSLQSYLDAHFADKPAFAALAGITVERLDQLIDAGAVPEATYACDGTTIRSAAFGVIETPVPVVGEYFRRQCVRWVHIADRAAAGAEKAAVTAALVDELRVSLAASGHVAPNDEVAVDALIQKYLPAFFDGTFGLCVADPSTGGGIVRKETLQERLTAVTANGSNPAPAGLSKDALLTLIDDYASAAMPFSPAEYARSSRKRLVDDLRPLVASA